MIKTSSILAVILLSLPIMVQAATDTRHYRGEIEFVTLSGTSCGETNPGDKIAVDVAVKVSGNVIDGYYSGQKMLIGHFSGNDAHNLAVAYQGAVPSATSEHRLSLSLFGDRPVGEIREKPLAAGKEGCNFDLARFYLQPVAQGVPANSVFARLEKLFQAEYENKMATTFYDRGKMLEAIRHFEVEIALREAAEGVNSHTLLDPLMLLSVAYSTTDHFDKGKKLLERALSLPIEPLKRKIWRTVVLQKLFIEQAERMTKEGEPSKAVGFLNKVVAAYPDLTQLYYYMAETMINLRDPEEVCLQIDNSLREHRDDTNINNAHALCLVWKGKTEADSGNLESAINLFKEAQSFAPEDPEILCNLGEAYIANGEPDVALSLLQKNATMIIEKLSQEDYGRGLAVVYAAIGERSAKKQDYATAELKYRQALENDPLNTAYTVKLAGVVHKSGRYDEALRILDSWNKKCTDAACRNETTKAIEHERQLEQIVKKIGN